MLNSSSELQLVLCIMQPKLMRILKVTNAPWSVRKRDLKEAAVQSFYLAFYEQPPPAQ